MYCAQLGLILIYLLPDVESRYASYAKVAKLYICYDYKEKILDKYDILITTGEGGYKEWGTMP